MDVARLAGVSHQTVSRVINAPDSVRPGTRERAQRAIEELGYRRNMAARALVTDSTRTIGVTTVSSHFFGPASTTTAIEDAARAAGYACLVSALRSDDPEEVDDLLAFSVNRGVDGIIALAPRRPSRGRRPGPPGRSRSFSSPTGSSRRPDPRRLRRPRARRRDGGASPARPGAHEDRAPERPRWLVRRPRSRARVTGGPRRCRR
ncbi:LacI family DNA-binding transcriptional regulator [Actinomyces haliotis]|uniref:LacI family DNA-binding transcriptional regulator n=1 Tax=Actinomyces haliotis TaxID=1280843 RepID=UPI001E6576EA|nr:LacI family DNA-binding transcriptional regulator [Actinomyces haliotis]